MVRPLDRHSTSHTQHADALAGKAVDAVQIKMRKTANKVEGFLHRHPNGVPLGQQKLSR